MKLEPDSVPGTAATFKVSLSVLPSHLLGLKPTNRIWNHSMIYILPCQSSVGGPLYCKATNKSLQGWSSVGVWICANTHMLVFFCECEHLWDRNRKLSRLQSHTVWLYSRLRPPSSAGVNKTDYLTHARRIRHRSVGSLITAYIINRLFLSLSSQQGYNNMKYNLIFTVAWQRRRNTATCTSGTDAARLFRCSFLLRGPRFKPPQLRIRSVYLSSNKPPNLLTDCSSAEMWRGGYSMRRRTCCIF